MAEYIERKKALNVCEMHYQHCLEMRDWHGDRVADDIKTDIETIPAADVVEVVRCKDCKYSKIEEYNFPTQYFCGYTGMNWNEEDHFCSYGERKDDNGR